MKHLDPRQLPKEAFPTAKPKTSATRWIALAAVVTFGFGAAATWLFPTSSVDRVTQAERDNRQNEFTRLREFTLVPIDAGEARNAIDQMQLPPTDRAALESTLRLPARQTAPSAGAALNSSVPATSPAAAPVSGKLRLARFDFWDTHAQDGDIVAFVSAGYRREVPLTHGTTSVTIPVDGSGVVQIVGVHDGGGGITLGLRGANQEVLMPIMSEGQTLSLPVAR